MRSENWKEKTNEFEVMDVRGRKLELKAKAAGKKNGEGLHIIQTFDPIPLYPVLALMGYEHFTEKTGENEYHAYFYRTKKGDQA